MFTTNTNIYRKDDFVWCFKYSPKSFEDLILLDRLKSQFEKIIKTKQMSDMLLYGPPGLGKTTIANVLKHELDLDVLYLNGSLETSVDDIRTTVKSFIKKSSMKQKMVFVDECLEENEEILIGTKQNTQKVKLKDLPKNKYFNLISLNTITEEIEDDVGIIHLDRDCDVYEVELEDGRTICVSDNHPFLVRNNNGDIVEKSLLDGLKEKDLILSF